jgi:hypothetical protein
MWITIIKAGEMASATGSITSRGGEYSGQNKQKVRGFLLPLVGKNS